MSQDQSTFFRPMGGVTYSASDMLGRGYCALALGGFPVWMGRVADIPPGQRFDHITMHPGDIAEMEEVARAR